MTKKLNISLDLETWGTEPGDDIRSIGACVFDPVSGTVYDGGSYQHGNTEPFYIACDNPIIGTASDWIGTLAFTPNPADPCFDVVAGVYRRYPLKRDPRTVQWWSEQTKEAQAAFANPVDLKEALQRFSTWYYSLACAEPQQVRLWSHGSHFDGPILAAAYRAVGLPVPWHYRAPRDTRTIFDAAGIDDHSAWLAERPGPLGILHHSLDDSICQARAVCAAWQKIKIASSTNSV